MKNILILGGSGILSLDVLKQCLEMQYTVTCITRGTRDHRLPQGVRTVHGDIHRLEDILDQLDSHYDAILDFLSFDVKGLKYKLDRLSSRCGQYFFVSSSVAYSFEDHIITENTKLGNEYWDYGSNKVRCEEFLRKNARKYGITYTIIRPYITYGKTRIPFGVIPVNGEYWTLANRILHNKPILLWDGGQARCTLTHTEDFAKAYVDLIGNPKAYSEAFHITSNEVLTWADVLGYLGKELGKTPAVFSETTENIVKILPEYAGVLWGDKARDRIFDNSKIVDASPRFRNLKPFSQGISETIQYYLTNPIERTMDYTWDGRIDRAILLLAKQSGRSVDRSALRFAPAEKKVRLRDRIAYWGGKHPLFGRIVSFFSIIPRLPGKVLKVLLKAGKKIRSKLTRGREEDAAALYAGFHSVGTGCKLGNCDFGQDRKMISIGNQVVIQDGVRFINYRPTAEHFDRIFESGNHPKLRDLGPICIEDHVFIASNATILPNVTIGKDSLVLENSVVFDPVPPGSVIRGNPAKVVDTIEHWRDMIMARNLKYPWYEKDIPHHQIVQEREFFFFED